MDFHENCLAQILPSRGYAFCHISIISLFMIFFGNRIYGIKRLKKYGNFFHYPDKPFSSG